MSVERNCFSKQGFHHETVLERFLENLFSCNLSIHTLNVAPVFKLH